MEPSPLAGSGYTSEHSNFLCLPFLGHDRAGDTFPLPCAASRLKEWRTAPLLQRFVITAWWPPTPNVWDAYADAGFNVLLGGNIAAGCQQNGTLSSPTSYSEAFECVARALPRLEQLGLKFIWSNELFNNTHTDPSGLLLGGSSSLGGVSDSSKFGGKARPGYITAPEISWVLKRLRERNLSHLVQAFELHDDITTVMGDTAAAADWLRAHAPSILPIGNAGYGAASSLYEARMPIMSPEEYAIANDVANVTRAADLQLSYYSLNQMAGDRYRLDTWPLFNLGVRSAASRPPNRRTPRVRPHPPQGHHSHPPKGHHSRPPKGHPSRPPKGHHSRPSDPSRLPL